MTNLELTFRQAPFVRILAPFIAGIVFVDVAGNFNPIVSLSLAIISFVILFFFRKAGFSREPLFGITLFFTLFFFGFFISASHHIQPEEMEEKTYIGILDNYPVEKNNSFKALIRITSSNEKIFAITNKTADIKEAQPGDKLIFRGKPKIITNRGNPFEFDYKSYLLRKHITHTVFLDSLSFRVYSGKNRLTLKHSALVVRKYLINQLMKFNLQGEPLSVISAIVLGSRDNLENETRESFSRSGAMHVLAVSGLHVGIVYIVLASIFNFLIPHKRGKIIKLLIILTGLWSYAFISGLSPSVLRASTMFSVIVIGNNINRRSNIYNSLTASAFILLMIDPELIYDVGFQLSYSAVIAIVYLQPKLYKSITFRLKLPDKIWALTTVSLAAQIGTLPLSLYYFHKFPVYFWLSNLVAIPLVTIIIYNALLFFVLAPVPIIGNILAISLEKIVELLIRVVKTIENLPASVIENIALSKIEMILVFGIIISLVSLIINRKGINILISICFSTLLLISHTYGSYRHLNQKEIIVLNIPGRSLLMFISGKEAIIYNSGKEDLSKFNYYIKPVILNHKIVSEVYIKDGKSYISNEQNISIHKNFVNFYGTKITFLTDSLFKNNDVKNIPESDIIIVAAKNKAVMDMLKNNIDKSITGTIIMDGSTSTKTRKNLVNSDLRENYKLVNTTTEGGIILKVN
jgi:competence protein ComEC